MRGSRPSGRIRSRNSRPLSAAPRQAAECHRPNAGNAGNGEGCSGRAPATDGARETRPAQTTRPSGDTRIAPPAATLQQLVGHLPILFRLCRLVTDDAPAQAAILASLAFRKSPSDQHLDRLTPRRRGRNFFRTISFISSITSICSATKRFNRLFSDSRSFSRRASARPYRRTCCASGRTSAL